MGYLAATLLIQDVAQSIFPTTPRFLRHGELLRFPPLGTHLTEREPTDLPARLIVAIAHAAQALIHASLGGGGNASRKVNASAVGPWAARCSSRRLPSATIGRVPAGTHQNAMCGPGVSANHS